MKKESEESKRKVSVIDENNATYFRAEISLPDVEDVSHSFAIVNDYVLNIKFTNWYIFAKKKFKYF
jgi:hypothetical protein